MDTEDWLRSLLEAYRKRVATLADAARKRLQAITDLSAPCQITAFEFTNPVWQAIILTHSRTGLDKAITVVRPHGWELIETFDRLLADPLWSDTLIDEEHSIPPSDPEANLRWVGDRLMMAVFDQFRASHLKRPHDEYSRFMQMSLFGSHCALWVHYGAISDVDVSSFLDGEFRQAESEPGKAIEAQSQSRATQVPVMPTERPYPGHGAFCAPRRTVGRLSGISIAERMFGTASSPGRLVHRGQVGGLEVMVTHPGYVGLETPNKSEANRWLNLIAAGFCQAGFPTYGFRDQDIGGFYPPSDEAGHPFWGGEFPSARGAQTDGHPIFADWHAQWVSIDDLSDCLDRAETLSLKPYAGEIPLLLEANTHLLNHEFTPSLVFSWAIIERAIGRLWREYLGSRGVGGRRKDKLLDTAFWTVDDVVETLDLNGTFPTELYAPMMATKKTRNEVFHGDRLATRDEARTALGLAEKLLVGTNDVILAPPRPTPFERKFSKKMHGSVG